MARRINADDRLRMLAWHTHWRLFISKDDHWFRGWPRLEKRLGEDAGLFFLTIAADTIPRTRAFHQRLGIEEEVTHLTCMELRSFSANYAESSGGRLGVPLGQMIWLRHYTQENYFRLGRYEFWLRKHSDAEVILRHRANRKVVALARRAGGLMPTATVLMKPTRAARRVGKRAGRNRRVLAGKSSRPARLGPEGNRAVR